MQANSFFESIVKIPDGVYCYLNNFDDNAENYFRIEET